MPEKQKSAKKPRAHKVSGGVHGSGGKLKPPLTEIQKILICNGGMGHHLLRKGKVRFTTPKVRATRAQKKGKQDA